MNQNRRSEESNNHPPYYYPYNDKPRRGGANLASCAVATVFLIAAAAAAFAVYFFLFRPKTPVIAVNGIQFPSFSASNGAISFHFIQYVTVTNPNRGEFSHYDNSLQLVYAGEPVGIIYIPAGRIAGGGRQRMSAEFDLQKYPRPPPGDTMEIETRMKLAGSVRVLKLFKHRVESRVECTVWIEATRGTVSGYRC